MNLLALALVLVGLAAVPARADDSVPNPLVAPPVEELDRQADAFVRRKQIGAVVVIGATLIGGFGASFLRRRARRRAAAAVASAPTEPLTAEQLLHTHPSLRGDRLRKALRGEGVDARSIEADVEGWAELFEADPQPGLRALIMEALAGVDGPVAERMRRRALEDPAASVRLEGYRQLLDRDPADADALLHAALDDWGIEVCLLAAERLVRDEPERCARAVLKMVEAEALGSRESHALRRGLGFLAEELRDPRWIDAIEALRDSCEDVEGTIDWALAVLREETQE